MVTQILWARWMEEQQYAATNIVCLHQPSTQVTQRPLKKLHIFLKNPKSYKLKKNMVLDVWYSMQ